MTEPGVDPVLEAAREACAAGLCIVPPAEDGTKRPFPDSTGRWDSFKTRRPSREELRGWYPGRTGLGVIAGAVSGRTECWDFDELPTYEAFVTAARELGLEEVVQRIEAGYCDDTPGDGVRWLVHYDEAVEREPGGRVVLARRPGRDAEPKVVTLIELPAFNIVAPTNGHVHPSGRPYVRRSGGFGTISSYTSAERGAMIALARSFDAMPEATVVREPSADRGSGGTRPGDVWATRTSWSDILGPHGWTKVFTRGKTTYWRRPEKAHGWSATTGHTAADTLAVFSTSTVFDEVTSTKKTYSKFAAFAELEHRGDFSAAAKALAAQGYGEPARAPEAERPSKPAYTGPSLTLDAVLDAFRGWLHLPDEIPVYAVLGAVAANLLPGDPVWLGIVAPPSSAKTEILNGLALLPDVYPTATLTPAALLSGTPKKQRSKQARGGLLREIGEFGIILMKDFGSVLSMRAESKAEVLAALREVYDGSWTRHLGTEGGTSYSWAGKVGLVFGVTPAIDSHHGVIGAMGERFCVVRMSASGAPQLGRALEHAGQGAGTMRRELAEAVAGLFAGQRREPRQLAPTERDQLISMATTAVRIRSTVERDRRSM